MKEISTLLTEKATLHGDRGGFFENNFPGEGRSAYSHACGEARIKIAEFRKNGNKRHLLKAITWLYLIYESEGFSE